jgi:catechol 2,3-dioxygenase-like lactoylglutathione lyase family enzyme
MKNSLPTLRIARPTGRLHEIVAMYVQGLGFQKLGGFTNHDGFDGTMVGIPGQPYHLEFTHERGVPSEPPPSSEHLLVFYEPDPKRWEECCTRMETAGFVRVPSHNPYWDQEGATFRDLDGYRVVWCRRTWTA